jgi:hypothetical protein
MGTRAAPARDYLYRVLSPDGRARAAVSKFIALIVKTDILRKRDPEEGYI